MGHERASLFPLSGLKAQVTVCKRKGQSTSLPCNSGSGLADLRMTENSILATHLRQKKLICKD